MVIFLQLQTSSNESLDMIYCAHCGWRDAEGGGGGTSPMADGMWHGRIRLSGARVLESLFTTVRRFRDCDCSATVGTG